ncbi:acetyl-CoA C-acetyltransferase [Candidatus Spongiihabitans sp.]|uniref:acetyl-CoA C-acetyltransferase n=1 Tax=Candidatus Spongiihabitans sp. TaxID=3101308 RepID=UPI003C7DA8F8
MHSGRDVYLIDGSRTPFLKAAGQPGKFKAADLAVAAGRPLITRQPFRATDFDEIILGCVAPTADEANIARIVSLRLGCGESTPAWTVARNCASGMQALDSAATNIALGRSDLALAGGTESMSHTPVLFSTEFVAWLGRWAKAKTIPSKLKTLTTLKPSCLVPIIGLLRGLTDPICGLSMGQTAEKIAYRFGITREAMDAFAVRSHQRLAAAADEQKFAGELETIYDNDGNSYHEDDGLRRDSTVEKLAKLRPVFDRPTGRVTAGNSAQITDGCAWLILASEVAVNKYGLIPRAQIIDSQWAGVDPTQMGLGPVHASTPILQRHSLRLDEVDYWEINEAFAGQVLGCLAAWNSEQYCKNELGLDSTMGELDQDRLNLDGGGVSMGHPVGASGARIVLHALHVLERNQWQRAMATLCIGGGQGGAMLIQRSAP